MTSEEYIGRKAPRWYVVLLRLFMALYFIYIGVCGLNAWRADGAVFAKGFAEVSAEGTQIQWFRPFLDTVIEPIKDNVVFGILLWAAPLLLGLSLLFGLLTRLSTFLGILFVLGLCLIKWHHGKVCTLQGISHLQDAYTLQLLLHFTTIAGLSVIFFSAAGRTFGIDGIFWRNRIRLRFEPEVPKELKAAAPRKPVTPVTPVTAGPAPIPLAEPRPAKVEESVGEFPSAFKPEETPGGTKPEPKPEKKPEQKDEKKGESTPGIG